jgi:carotenoid cleavage dioxygenase-like enzyme
MPHAHEEAIMAMPMAKIESRNAPKAPRCLTLLGISERGGRDEAPVVEGNIPRELNGSLYRNGPGLFERGGLRKPHLLDGDGLVQRLSCARRNSLPKRGLMLSASPRGRCAVRAV